MIWPFCKINHAEDSKSNCGFIPTSRNSKREDRGKYIEFLKKYSGKWECPVIAYCLMGNHVHLLVRPKREESLHKMMQGLTLSYTQYVNRKYERTGRLWESRYHSCIIDTEYYLWAVARYIEQNPRRAKIVKKEEQYPYSSARAHIQGKKDERLRGIYQREYY
jgi:putative transposase